MTDKDNNNIVYGDIYLSPEFWDTDLKMKRKGVHTAVKKYKISPQLFVLLKKKKSNYWIPSSLFVPFVF